VRHRDREFSEALSPDGDDQPTAKHQFPRLRLDRRRWTLDAPVIWSDRSPQRDQHSIPGWRRVVPWQGIDLARRRIDKNWRALAQLAHYRDMHRWSGPRHAATLASAVQYSVICTLA